MKPLTKNFKVILLIVILPLIICLNSFAQPVTNEVHSVNLTLQDSEYFNEFIQDLVQLAAKYSNRKPIPLCEMPPIQILDRESFNKKVCPENPENCKSLMGIFDDLNYVIYLPHEIEITESDLELSWGEIAKKASFYLHEIVHVLQYREEGPMLFRTCKIAAETENEAYLAQNKYLSAAGDIFRVPGIPENVECNQEEERELERIFLKSLDVWTIRNNDKDHWNKYCSMNQNKTESHQKSFKIRQKFY